MPSVTAVLTAGSYDPARIVDAVILDRAQRHARSGAFAAVSGTPIELDLPAPAMLRMGDALVLEDGRLVEVVAEAEPLLEVRAADLSELARLAWRLGDRHIPLQVYPNRLRVSRDPPTEAVLKRLGATFVAIEAPFEPEGGAYRVPAHGAHDHGRHAHGHHAHDHGHHLGSHDHPASPHAAEKPDCKHGT